MKTIGIVGGGFVGRSIAEDCLRAGHEVRLYEKEVSLRDVSLIQQVKGSQFAFAKSPLDLAGSSILIEAVVECLQIKIDVLKALSVMAPSAEVLVTTTSSFTVNQLAASIDAGELLIGVHPMPPTSRGRLAEIASGMRTSSSVEQIALAFAQELGWTTLTVKDRPGRVSRRLLMPFLNQSIQALDDGLASASDIDRVAELGLGLRQGPLATVNRMGIEDHLASTTETYRALRDPALCPPPLLSWMVAGRRGRNQNLPEF